MSFGPPFKIDCLTDSDDLYKCFLPKYGVKCLQDNAMPAKVSFPVKVKEQTVLLVLHQFHNLLI